MFNIILAGGVSILGLNPALFAFVAILVLFGGLNLLEYKRFD